MTIEIKVYRVEKHIEYSSGAKDVEWVKYFSTTKNLDQLETMVWELYGQPRNYGWGEKEMKYDFEEVITESI